MTNDVRLKQRGRLSLFSLPRSVTRSCIIPLYAHTEGCSFSAKTLRMWVNFWKNRENMNEIYHAAWAKSLITPFIRTHVCEILLPISGQNFMATASMIFRNLHSAYEWIIVFISIERLFTSLHSENTPN